MENRGANVANVAVRSALERVKIVCARKSDDHIGKGQRVRIYRRQLGYHNTYYAAQRFGFCSVFVYDKFNGLYRRRRSCHERLIDPKWVSKMTIHYIGLVIRVSGEERPSDVNK